MDTYKLFDLTTGLFLHDVEYKDQNDAVAHALENLPNATRAYAVLVADTNEKLYIIYDGQVWYTRHLKI